VTPSRTKRITPPPPYTTPSVGKRSRPVRGEDEDEFGIDGQDPALDDELRDLAAVETPRKAAKTESYMTPRRRLPWESLTGIPTPSTKGKGREQDDSTIFTRSRNKREEDSSQTLSPGSPLFNTPTPSRFKDMSADSLVEEVFNLLDDHSVQLSNEAAAALKTLLTKHARRAEGNNRSKEVLRLRNKAEEAKVVELTHRNNTLQAELEAAKATVEHLNWEKEHGSDI
jgi:hypothetical protein